MGFSRAVLTCAIAATVVLPAWAQGEDAERAMVRKAVDQFLDDLGNRRLERLPAMFTPKATMVVVRQQRDGQWGVTYQTFDEWFAGLQKQANAPIFREPLSNVSVHVESGRLAFVRAAFTVEIDGQVRSHGVDYFTLVKDGNAWKLSGTAYTSIAGPPTE